MTPWRERATRVCLPASLHPSTPPARRCLGTRAKREGGVEWVEAVSCVRGDACVVAHGGGPAVLCALVLARARLQTEPLPPFTAHARL